MQKAQTWVAMPTGQVLVWHLRIMMQPMVMSGAVAKPNSSAPSSAATARSRPVRIWPSACSTVRPRRSFATSVWCVSARPSSHGRPANPHHSVKPRPSHTSVSDKLCSILAVRMPQACYSSMVQIIDQGRQVPSYDQEREKHGTTAAI